MISFLIFTSGRLGTVTQNDNGVPGVGGGVGAGSVRRVVSEWRPGGNKVRRRCGCVARVRMVAG